MKKTKFTEEQILFALKLWDSGQPIADVCRQMGHFTGGSWPPPIPIDPKTRSRLIGIGGHANSESSVTIDRIPTDYFSNYVRFKGGLLQHGP